jgi:hypothetical protein
VLTAGGDQIFPRGLPVGTVEKVVRSTPAATGLSTSSSPQPPILTGSMRCWSSPPPSPASAPAAAGSGHQRGAERRRGAQSRSRRRPRRSWPSGSPASSIPSCRRISSRFTTIPTPTRWPTRRRRCIQTASRPAPGSTPGLGGSRRNPRRGRRPDSASLRPSLPQSPRAAGAEKAAARAEPEAEPAQPSRPQKSPTPNKPAPSTPPQANQPGGESSHAPPRRRQRRDH